ncbi:ATP-binding protein [Phaeospirillum tilakii]|uniref:ATP-binding protein n=1 Tax=Phaeospirillum tilakii TaxID=741673 RepID=A0ABW5C9B0_9PROT
MDGARLDLVLDNRTDEVARLLAAFEAFAAGHGLPHKVTMQVMLALEELAVNIVRHAFPEGGRHRIEIGLELGADHLVCDLRDDGLAFDPFAQAPPPDLTGSTAERRVGGLGVHLVRRMMDEVAYRRDGGINHTRAVKRW